MGRKLFRFLAASVVAMALYGCPVPTPVVPPPVDADAASEPPGDAAVPPATMVDVAAPVDVVEAGVDARAPIPAGQCGDTYRHLRTDIACEPKHPASATWVQACETARANGFTFQLRCLNLATTKGAVAKCGATCLP